MNIGEIDISVVKAKIKLIPGIFLKIEPFVKINLGLQSKKTQAIKNSTLEPEWKESLSFMTLNNHFCIIIILDRDRGERDNLIGKVVLDLFEVYEEKELKKWFQIFRKKKNVGKLFLNVKFTQNLFIDKYNEENFSKGYEVLNKNNLEMNIIRKKKKVKNKFIRKHYYSDSYLNNMHN